ncbi:hypothetical protein FNV43_RR16323 [Rhamnella rubrinervis]|uniref:Uncharacterized protein n=1 Tax=Rhamnella rubrinervis TaxID=2594499 RepID=A0A8K0GYK3_9ROSA|nr:hypothetical protein FNV43_RR16323 [Rhamnella rubrinervis]
MDPYYEQRLRDEVIYLHSLWYQGPPANTCTPFQPLPDHTHAHTKRVRGNIDWSAKKRPLRSDPRSNSTTTQWPCSNPVPDNTPATSSCWPAMKPTSAPLARQMSAEERVSHSKLQLQYRALDTCREFFARKDGSESDEDDDEFEEEDDGFDEEDDDENKEYNFFLGVFSENNELRTYYEENYQSSEFVCLVCEKGKNYGKKVKGCVALVQHSMAISKTIKKRAHRAFGQVICRVMGWDIDRLPMIVLKGEPLGRTLAKTGVMQGELPGANTGNHEGFSGCVTENAVALNVNKSEPSGKDAYGSHQKNDDEKLVTCEVSIQSLVSSADRPCKNPIENSPSAWLEWPAFNPHPASATCAVSAEEQSRSAALQLQQKALETCKDFFVGNSKSDGDECQFQGEDESVEDCEEFKFFSRVFTEDHNLRSFYENNYEAGEFYCLICAGIGKKVWKRFTGCVALVQHSTAISKTKKKLAHRAYGRVICKVLGCNQLPTIKFEGNPLGQPSAKSDNLQEKPKEDSDCCKDGKVSSEKGLKSENGEVILKDSSDDYRDDDTSL